MASVFTAWLLRTSRAFDWPSPFPTDVAELIHRPQSTETLVI